MTIFDQAYQLGQADAFEKFALVRGAGIRAPGVTVAPVPNAMPHMSFAKDTAAHVAPAQTAPAAPQGWLSKAWGGLNRVASNPVGQMALGIGAPMLIGSMMSGNNSQQQG